MKEETILEMARKAGCGHESMTLDWIAPEGLTSFAKLVEQATLERAAKVCEDYAHEALTENDAFTANLLGSKLRNLKGTNQ